MNPIVAQLKKYGSFSEDASKDIVLNTNHFFKTKGDHFLRAGQRVSSYFVLNKGIIRAYFSRKGKEVNTWFGEEHQIFCSILPVYTDNHRLKTSSFLKIQKFMLFRLLICMPYTTVTPN